MAVVVLVRGVNAGGHRTFRPSVRAGALRAQFARRLPFDAQIMICQGHELARLLSRDFFAADAARPDVVPFVSVLARSPAPRRQCL